MEKYIRLTGIKEIPANRMKVFNVEGHEILVVNVEERFYAFENRCPHMRYPLHLGSLDGKVLTCGFHYAKFNVETGKSLGSVTYKSLNSFKLKIQNSSILVKLQHR